MKVKLFLGLGLCASLLVGCEKNIESEIIGKWKVDDKIYAYEKDKTCYIEYSDGTVSDCTYKIKDIKDNKFTITTTFDKRFKAEMRYKSNDDFDTIIYLPEESSEFKKMVFHKVK